MSHIPVLQKEVIELFLPRAGENFIDATIGGGGHAFKILEHTSPNGKILGIDANKETVEGLEKNLEGQTKKRLILVCDNFSNLQDIVRKYNFHSVRGILADLGFSSTELEMSSRGFSFLKNEPLDMRYGETELTAEKIINDWQEKELADIFYEYGEERFSRRIAGEIIGARRIKRISTTFQLVDIVKKATPSFYHQGRLNPATKVFQALRIAVNGELDNLRKFLPQAIDILDRGGKLVVISFHSLEDRIVKNFLKEKKQEKLIKILTKKIIRPFSGEIANNPRSRSAKLRAAIKI